MKILDTPRSGKCGQVVAFQSRYGLCLRQWVPPRNTITPAREFMRQALGHHSRVYSHTLTEAQLDRWHLAAGQVMSDPRLGQYGPLTGQQLYTSINSVRSRVNLPETLEVPVRPGFSSNPVGELVISNSADGVRLLLRVSGELTEDVMIFGQAPCSTGRRKRRNVAYVGLLPPPVDGWSDITDLYTARYGEPRPGTKVFLVTCQQKDGWKARDWETSAVVPEPSEGQRAESEDAKCGAPLPSEARASGFPAPLTSETSHERLMYKGGTRAAQGKARPQGGRLTGSGEGGKSWGKAAGAASGGGEAGEGTG